MPILGVTEAELAAFTQGLTRFTEIDSVTATQPGATNTIPAFITQDGPVRAARFVLHPDGTPDGGVQDLFVITSAALSNQQVHLYSDLLVPHRAALGSQPAP